MPDLCRVSNRFVTVAAERCETSEPFNVGTGIETRIRDLAETICALVGYEGETVWDDSRPDGRTTLYLDVTRARESARRPPQPTRSASSTDWIME